MPLILRKKTKAISKNPKLISKAPISLKKEKKESKFLLILSCSFTVVLKSKFVNKSLWTKYENKTKKEKIRKLIIKRKKRDCLIVKLLHC